MNFDEYKKGWTGGLPETPCGAGSMIKNTKKQIKWIPEIVKKYNIQTIANIGAGDLNWWNRMQLTADVTHYDLVPRKETVIQFDVIKQIPPKVDLIACFWVLNHLGVDECRAAIKNMKLSGSKYLMMTDVSRYHPFQPEEIKMPHIEIMENNELFGCIKLIEL